MSNYRTLILCEDRDRAAELYTDFKARYGDGGYDGNYRFMTDRVMFSNYLTKYIPQEHRYVRMVRLDPATDAVATEINDWWRTKALGYVLPGYRGDSIYVYEDSAHTNSETIDYIYGQAYAARLDFRESADSIMICILGM